MKRYPVFLCVFFSRVVTTYNFLVMSSIKGRKKSSLLALLVLTPWGRLLFVSSTPDARSCNQIQLLRPHEVNVIGQCLVNKQHTPQITAGNWNKRTGPAAAAFTLANVISPEVRGFIGFSRQQGESH